MINETLEDAIKQIKEMKKDFIWIDKVARINYEQDEKLRSNGARTLKRIFERAEKHIE